MASEAPSAVRKKPVASPLGLSVSRDRTTTASNPVSGSSGPSFSSRATPNTSAAINRARPHARVIQPSQTSPKTPNPAARTLGSRPAESLPRPKAPSDAAPNETNKSRVVPEQRQRSPVAPNPIASSSGARTGSWIGSRFGSKAPPTGAAVNKVGPQGRGAVQQQSPTSVSRVPTFTANGSEDRVTGTRLGPKSVSPNIARTKGAEGKGKAVSKLGRKVSTEPPAAIRSLSSQPTGSSIVKNSPPINTTPGHKARVVSQLSQGIPMPPTASTTSSGSRPPGSGISFEVPPTIAAVTQSGQSHTREQLSFHGFSTSQHKWKCFRISGIPADWDKAKLVTVLEKQGGSLSCDSSLSLYPALCGFSQVALLNLSSASEYFQSILQDESRCVMDGDIAVAIDSHFYGLTPLNVPDREIFADVVAVTGLAGHAFGSWKNRESNQMWLQDFLPNDVKNIRIMTYGYNSSLVGPHASNIRILDHRRDLVSQVNSARTSDEEKRRRIIFLGHSLGGILILQALLQCKNQDIHKHLLEATHAILFFGTPHRGFRTPELEAMVTDMGSDTYSNSLDLLRNLCEGAEFLESQADQLCRILSRFKIVTYYETEKTPTVTKNPDTEQYERMGKLEDMVKNIWAQLYLPNEDRIPVQKNHTEMVKFPICADGTYISVFTKIKEFMGSIRGTTKKEISERTRKAQNDCLQSLAGADCEGRRDELLLKRHTNTCTWLLDAGPYRMWSQEESRTILWIHGGPGCGKSVLSAFLCKQWSETAHDTFGKDFLLAYFSCDAKDERLKTADSILLNWVKQILRQEPNTIVHFLAEAEYNGKKTLWNFHMLLRVFTRIVQDPEIRPLCVLIDALDECEEKSCLIFLNQLRLLLDSNTITGRLKLLITSRPHLPIASHVEPVNVTEISLDADNLSDDIAAFVTHEVGKLQFPTAFAQYIREKLIEGAGGMFLWVSLIIDDIKNCKNTKRSTIQKKLETLPRTLPEVYKNVLCKIEPEDQPYANSILRWVAWAMRPLSLQELRIAIAVRPEDVSIESMEEEMEMDLPTTLRKNFGPMLVIKDGIVHLVHQSAKDFLCNYLPEHDQFLPNWDFLPNVSNGIIAIGCLTYLSFAKLRSLPSFIYSHWRSTMLQENDFVEYSAQHWATHVQQVDREHQEKIALWRPFWRLAESRQKLNMVLAITSGRCEEDTAQLQIAAYFGLPHFVEKLIDSGALVNEHSGEQEYSALCAAVDRGHEAVVRLLLDRGADINPRVDGDKSAISYAANRGHENLVRLLLDWGTDINAQEKNNALHYTISGRHEATFRLLLERGADINAPNRYGQTPLSEAASTGDEVMVRLLLDRGADINAQGLYGTALSCATCRHNLEMIQLLLERGADINTEDKRGETELLLATYDGHEVLVRLLLERGVDVNAQGPDSGTALLNAVRGKHETLVRLLLDRGAETNLQRDSGETALSIAAFNGYEPIVQLLLNAGADIAINRPLEGAAIEGHEALVRLLLDRGANINAEDKYGRTALSGAATEGHESIVRLLLEAGADVNAGEALRRVALNRHETMIRLLLDAGADVNAACKGDKTCTVLRLLLDRGADINAHDKEDRKHTMIRQRLETGADVNAGNAPEEVLNRYAFLEASPDAGLKRRYESIIRRLMDGGADTSALSCPFALSGPGSRDILSDESHSSSSSS